MSGGFITAAGWFTARSFAVIKRKPQPQRGRAAALALAAGGWRDGEGGCLFLVSFHFTGHFLAVNFVISGKRKKKPNQITKSQPLSKLVGFFAVIVIFSFVYGRMEMASREVRVEKYLFCQAAVFEGGSIPSQFALLSCCSWSPKVAPSPNL